MPRSQKLTASSASRKMKSAAVSSRRTKTRKQSKTAMSDSGTYYLGIDPGYKETGLVLRRGARIAEFQLLTDKLGRDEPMLFRSQALAQVVAGYTRRWCLSHNVRHLEIGLELPVYNRNVTAYAKQRSLIQAIESELARCVAPLVAECWLSEPIPSESKFLATGNGAAAKSEVLKASPVMMLVALSDGAMPVDSWETLSDAWSHSLAAGAEGVTRFNLKEHAELWIS